MSRLHLTTILFFAFFICTTSTVHAFTISKPATNNLGLVGHWTFDGTDTVWTSSTAGTVTDLSGNGNTGTLTNMNSSSAPTVGRVGQALEFDGTNNCVNAGNNSSLNIISTVTLSAWINPDSSGLNRVIVGKSAAGGGASSQQYHLIDQGSNSVRFAVTNTGSTNMILTTGSNSTPNGKWSHVVGVYDGIDTAYLYLNGELIDQSTAASFGDLNQSNKNVLIGATHGSSVCNGGYYDGKIDDARIYNRALSAQEIKALYNVGASKLSTSKTSVTDGLVGHWTMDGKDTVWTSSTAGTVTDKSGNGNTGTLVNMSATTSTALGKSGQALFFDGTDDRVSLGDMAAIENVSQASFAFWVKPETLITSAIYLAKYNNNNSNISFRISESNGGCGGDSDDIVMYTGSSGVCSRTNLNFLTPGKWNHIVYVFDGSQSTNDTKLKVYIDGLNKPLSHVGTLPTSLPETGSSLVLGSYSNGGSHSHGVMDDVRVYNRALTEDEIEKIYNETSEQKINVAPTNSNSGLNSGLVGHWTMDGKDTVWTSSSAATVIDKSGNGNTGTLTNMSASEAPVIGKVGQGLRFDGVDDQVTVLHSSSLNPSEITISFWLNQLAVVSGNNGSLINKNGTTGYRIRPSGSGGLQFLFNGGIEAFFDNLELNTWNHVVMVGNSNGTRFYVNNVVGSLDADPYVASASTGSLIIAGSLLNEMYMDDVRVYNRALTSSEIQQLYNMGK